MYKSAAHVHAVYGAVSKEAGLVGSAVSGAKKVFGGISKGVKNYGHAVQRSAAHGAGSLNPNVVKGSELANRFGKGVANNADAITAAGAAGVGGIAVGRMSKRRNK